jgi:uncharacterized protein YukE
MILVRSHPIGGIVGSFEGMDVGTVSNLIPQLRSQAQMLQNIASHTEGLVSQIHALWHGQASAHFLSQWESAYKPQLGHAQSAVSGLAQSLSNNLSDQEGASSPGGALASGATAGTSSAFDQAFWSSLDNPIFGGALGVGSLIVLFSSIAAQDFAVGPLAFVAAGVDGAELYENLKDHNFAGATWHGASLTADLAVIAAPDNPVGWCASAFIAGVGIGELIDHETGFSDHTSDMVIQDRVQGYGGTMTPQQADDLVNRYTGIKGPFYAASDTAGSVAHKVMSWF